MKELRLWVKVVLFLIFAAIVYGIVSLVLSKQSDLDKDPTNYSYEDVFYRDFKTIYDPATKSTKKPTFSDTGIGLRVIVIDQNLNPIPNSTIKFYDADNYYVVTEQTNKDGVIAIDNLPKDYKLTFKQIDTKDGLNIDKTPYTLTINKSTQYVQIIVNSDKDISDEEKEKIRNQYSEQHKSTKTIEVKEEQKTEKGIQYEYKFIAEDLLGYKLRVTEEPGNEITEGENKYKTAKFTIDIPGAEIQKIELISQQDRSGLTGILDMNMNPKTSFKGVESFYLKYKSDTWDNSIFYNANISFKVNNKNYEVCKRNILRTK